MKKSITLTYRLVLFSVAMFLFSSQLLSQWTRNAPFVYPTDISDKVGIGTASPMQALDVNGRINVAGGVIQRGGSPITSTGDLGLYSLETDFHMRFVTNNAPFRFFSDGATDPIGATDLFTIAANGFVGIGTPYPTQTLDVNGSVNVNGAMSVNDNAILLHFNNDNNHGLRYAGVGHPFANNTTIDGPAIYGFGGGILGSKNFNASTEKIALLWDINGNIGIGSDLLSNTYNNINNYFKLSVNGSIRSKEIVVETGWADFVFNENYKLITLDEVEKYINEKGHLPDIPSAKEVEENGVNVGELLKLQMQKIEELTLYLIEQDKRMQKMKKELDELKKKK